ncbi:helix-turn-helix domain-containing protein [Tumebacillus flagellatus]|uniref:AlbA family DNA-binding domain-containing protein n=1 Tax=Tumebacillus flagellatus TaxID=1157490 RepID=UPI001376EE05|nr:ATP-binding protein [Tumebacillus flagellatus]
MGSIERAIYFIENENESEYLDFKSSNQYVFKKDSLIKDIMAMANSKYEGDKYIILGVKESPDGTKEVTGLEETEIRDPATYYELVLSNIEPDIDFRFFHFEYSGKRVAAIEISKENNRRPYMLKKKYESLHAGYCLIRKGCHQNIAMRSDYEQFFSSNGKVEIGILRPYLSAIHEEEGCADMEIFIRNLSDHPVTFIGGEFIVRSETNEILTRHSVYGFNEFVGSDFKLSLSPKSELVGEIYVGFSSSDCFPLGLDEYGTSLHNYRFELTFWDTNKKDYSAPIEQGFVYAKGSFLWKVQLKSEQEKGQENVSFGSRWLRNMSKRK